MFSRYYARNQEKVINRLTDIHQPYRVANFYKITGLKGLKKTDNVRFTPYLYSTNEVDRFASTSLYKGKAGADLNFSPNSSMKILGTVNPDYAQLETDKEIINVSDLPTEYPEKRPFFYESSEFYPGAAVITRNIVDIKTGLKIIKTGGLFNYDLTGVLDGENNQWLLKPSAV
jgi:hypothetical protein